MWTPNILLIPGSVVMLESAWVPGGVERSEYRSPNWSSAQAPALQAITLTSGALRAVGRVESAAVPPYLSPPLSCLSPMTAGKAHSSRCVLETCLVTWNIHLLACSPAQGIFIHHVFYDTCDQFRGEIHSYWKWFPGCSQWWGGLVCKDKTCWWSESRFISFLTDHCVIGASGWTWSMASGTARAINQWT